MARKEVLRKYRLLNAVSMASDILSDPVDVTYQDDLGLQISWTGAPVGKIDIMMSVSGDPADYFAITLPVGMTQPSGTPDGYLFELNECPYPNYKIAYTRTSGTGNLTVWICGKEI